MWKRRWLCRQDWSCDGAGAASWLLVRCPVWVLSCSASYSLPWGKVTHFVLTFLENFVSSPFCLTLSHFRQHANLAGTLSGHASWVLNVAFCPDDTHFVSRYV